MSPVSLSVASGYRGSMGNANMEYSGHQGGCSELGEEKVSTRITKNTTNSQQPSFNHRHQNDNNNSNNNQNDHRQQQQSQ